VLAFCVCVQDDCTPIHFALADGTLPALKLLLMHGANLEAEDKARAREAI
jgi:hypothetical protein